MLKNEIGVKARAGLAISLCAIAGGGALYGFNSSSSQNNRNIPKEIQPKKIGLRFPPRSVNCSVNEGDPLKPVSAKLAKLIKLPAQDVPYAEYGEVLCTPGISEDEFSIADFMKRPIVANIEGKHLACQLGGFDQNQHDGKPNLSATNLPKTDLAYRYLVAVCFQEDGIVTQPPTAIAA